jgi:class 3 adenylate cyclase/uncharacterized membrane protein SpoIIM required for sporulation
MFIENKIKNTVSYIRRNNKRYIFTLILFLFSFLGGILYPFFFESYQQQLMGHTPRSGIETFLFLFANNGTIAFFAMLLGFILGIVPFFLIIFNGYMIGTVFFHALKITSPFDIFLRLIPHGIFEMPAIIISLGYGISSFDILYKNKSKRFNFKSYIKEYFKNMFDIYFLIVIPLLLISAFIETILIMRLKGESIPLLNELLSFISIPFFNIFLAFLLYGALRSLLLYLKKRESRYIVLLIIFFLCVSWLWMKLYGKTMSLFFETFSLITTFLPLVVFLVYLFIENQRYKVSEEKKMIQGAFQHYVAPALVSEILKNPEKLKLGGEKKEITVFFSDIRGFTSLSEKLGPEDLVLLLNNYLDIMTEIILDHKGVVDKYIGDAIMAFWGAPLDEPKHAYLGCKASLKMLEELKRLNIDLKKRGLPEINIGIGLNTNPMVVGNMGSNKRFDYTVIGDAVNLGSRLESINKQYGTNIIVSEYTRKQVIDDFEFRELDYVKVKGKDNPIRIYELISFKASGNLRLKNDFEKALNFYRQQEFTTAKELFLRLAKEGDNPSKVYIERCEEYINNPPTESWDGVFIMTKK